LYNNRGYLKYTKNDFPEAIKDYDIAISINEKYADAYYNKGIAEYCLNNYKGAIENYKKAVSIRPKYAKVYNDMGIALGSIGDLREAIISFDKAIEIDPKFPDTYFNRALAKYYSKDYAGSIEDCEKYLILETNNEKALKLKTAAMKELQKIK
jgi:tetratricopeptide (TPR) repeat protein